MHRKQNKSKKYDRHRVQNTIDFADDDDAPKNKPLYDPIELSHRRDMGGRGWGALREKQFIVYSNYVRALSRDLLLFTSKQRANLNSIRPVVVVIVLPQTVVQTLEKSRGRAHFFDIFGFCSKFACRAVEGRAQGG